MTAKAVGEARPAITATNIAAIVFFICLVLFLDCVLLVPEARFYCKGSVHAIPQTTVIAPRAILHSVGLALTRRIVPSLNLHRP